MPQVGTVDIDISNGGYGGTFTLADNGDLLLAVDTIVAPTATLERMARLILTNAAIVLYGVTVSEADDIFNDWYGSSIRPLIGQMITAVLISTIKAQILAALTTDPNLVQSPAPTLYVIAGNSSSIPAQIWQAVLQAGASAQVLQAAIFIFGTVTLVTNRQVPLPTVVLPASGTPIIIMPTS